MRPSTEIFLYELWFTAETLFQSSWRNLDGPDFDGWAWRTGLTRRLAQLERQRLVEPHPARATETARLVRLTDAGRLAALGGRDPLACWARHWDGRWRVFLFDLPRDSTRLRVKLHRLLRTRHLGFLQGSVWISPDTVGDLRAELAEVPVDPEGFVVFEGRPATGESDAALVAGAWDFATINEGYERWLRLARTVPRALPRGPAGVEAVRSWSHRELAAWRQAISIDPLLPDFLLPADYRGKSSWNIRCEMLRSLARLVRGAAVVG